MAKKKQATATPPSEAQDEGTPFLVIERQIGESDDDWAQVVRDLETSDQLIVHRLHDSTISLTRVVNRLEKAA
ncbi:uncharacterized protein DUF1654 [Modicisalibacter xianhensis]|uniref:Uncharacterized protein DUF1654 n=1 Tax=Modicisalibacter xianhensis TaxID=442341 RepID=A0A4R8FFG9_9GAMM|nr:DUF1654 domain-containing protein [Halomonas xianhensis]TDX24676.1 uncharacterized protein DUF1654 [Halomonas xianhensis]